MWGCWCAPAAAASAPAQRVGPAVGAVLAGRSRSLLSSLQPSESTLLSPAHGGAGKNREPGGSVSLLPISK